jgi:WD40 repeat protein
VILWDLTDPAHPRRLSDPLIPSPKGTHSLAFAPNRRIPATGSGDGTVILWDLKKLNDLREHTVERACSITRGGLNRDEWARYIPGLPYQATCPA